MKLNTLSGGDPQSVVAVVGGQIVKRDPLRGSHDSARNASPDHHRVFLSRLAQIAVVLLIGPVKLQELGIIIRKAVGGGVGHGGGEVAGQRRIVLFENFVMGWRCRIGSGHEIEVD